MNINVSYKREGYSYEGKFIIKDNGLYFEKKPLEKFLLINLDGIPIRFIGRDVFVALPGILRVIDGEFGWGCLRGIMRNLCFALNSVGYFSEKLLISEVVSVNISEHGSVFTTKLKPEYKPKAKNEEPKKVPQLGNERNSHYARLGTQTIQRMQKVLSPEGFQGAMRFNIEKYNERFGHKDDKLKEAKKIQDYSKWLVESLEGKQITVE